jgi:dolichol kinase
MKVWARKTYRIGVGSLFPLIYYFSPTRLLPLCFLLYFSGIMTVLEVLRRVAPGSYGVMVEHSKGILKEKPGYLLGTTNFLLANLFCIIFFSKSIAIAALLFLTYGDALATIVGKKYGKIRIFRGKSLIGSGSFFVTSFVIGIILMFLPWMEIGFLTILIGSFVAAIVELLPIPLDDNLTVAPIACIVMEILQRVLV